MALVLNWQKKLGYKKDPFVDKPTEEFIGQEELKEKINLFIIKEQRLAYIAVKKGEGLSSFLLWLRNELKGKLIIIPKECTTLEKLEKVLFQQCAPFYKKKNFGKLLLQVTKKEVVPLKEVYNELQKNPHMLVFEGKLSAGQEQLCKDLFEKTRIQVILANTTKDVLGKAPDMKISFAKYSKEELETILTKRIEAAGSVGTFPFDENERKKLYEQSNANPQAFLAHAKNRAIELSLKNIALPKKIVQEKAQEEKSVVQEEKTQKKYKEKTTDTQKQKKPTETEKNVHVQKEQKKTINLFGKIKFEIRSDEDKKKGIKKQKESNIKNEGKDNTAKEEHKEMEEMLAEIVSAGEGEKNE